MDLADRAVLVENGRIAREFAPEELASLDRRERELLGLRATDPADALAISIPRAGGGQREGRQRPTGGRRQAGGRRPTQKDGRQTPRKQPSTGGLPPEGRRRRRAWVVVLYCRARRQSRVRPGEPLRAERRRGGRPGRERDRKVNAAARDSGPGTARRRHRRVLWEKAVPQRPEARPHRS